MVKTDSIVSIAIASLIRFLIFSNSAFHFKTRILGEISYKECTTFNDMSGPAMINTFNEINKLVSARKIRSL